MLKRWMPALVGVGAAVVMALVWPVGAQQHAPAQNHEARWQRCLDAMWAVHTAHLWQIGQEHTQRLGAEAQKELWRSFTDGPEGCEAGLREMRAQLKVAVKAS